MKVWFSIFYYWIILDLLIFQSLHGHSRWIWDRQRCRLKIDAVNAMKPAVAALNESLTDALKWLGQQLDGFPL